jgi:ABC-2 type transport system permease protein
VKYAYICSRNSFRALDVFFWPLMDLLVWGFVTIYMLKVSNGAPTLITFLISAIILWNILYRAQQVVTTMFLDDVWSRNLLNIFVAPIRSREYVGAAFLMGLIQSTIVLFLLGLFAAFFYKFNLLSLGLSLGALFANLLLMGWAMGLLVIGLILRFGPPAEALAWALVGIVQPVSAVFYPVSVLPQWLQAIAWCTPSAHCFEGMRQIISTGQVDPMHIVYAFFLNVMMLIVAGFAFSYFLDGARRKGFLAKYAA